jgi:hypothetical protein
MTRLKQHRTDTALSNTWPKDGDRLSAIETRRRVMVMSHDAQLKRTMANADRVIARFRRAYEALADA